MAETLQQQRRQDLVDAAGDKRSGNTSGNERRLNAARTLGQEIKANAATTAPTTTAATAIDPATGYAYGSTGDTQTLAAQTTTNTSNAVNSISATLSGLGLSGMSSWATSTVSALVGKGIDPTTAVNTVLSQMNAPQNADGSANQTALDAFNAALPGFNQLIANTGQNGSPGASPAQAIAAYISYGAQVEAFASTLGLPAGTITAQDIGNYWADQKSTTEVSERLTDVSAAANSLPQQVKDYLSNNFNMTPAQITAYYINPQNTMNQINQMNNAAFAGGEASITGFNPNLSLAQSQALGAFLANGSGGASSSNAGAINAITAGQANSFFQSGIAGGVQGTIAQLGAGLTSGNGATVTADQLIAAGEGSAQDINAVSQAQQTRTAGARGGGGAAATSNGAVGLGFANS